MKGAVQGAATAKRHVGELPGVVSFFNRDHPDRTGHLGVGHADDGFGCGHGVQPERLADMLQDGRLGGFDIEASLFNVIEGGNHVAMAKTACLTALEFTNNLYTSRPDVVVICGDRFEQLAIAMAAAYMNIAGRSEA